MLLDGTAPFELAIACEVFGLDRSDLGVPWYRFKPCAHRPGPITTTGGFSINAEYGLDDLVRADTVWVPAAGLLRDNLPEAALEALRAAHRRGARVMSVCTGAFVLAAAGLLDGRPATTHWRHSDELATRYPAVDVHRGVLYVDDGDVLTSAGTAAGIDMALHVVRKDHGAEVANGLARRMVVPPHRDGGQAQFVEAPVPVSADDDELGPLLAWLVEHLDETHTVELLAARASMSPRTLARRFRALTGTTPLQWILGQRILLAQRLLETTDEPVERIAARAGFGSAAALRVHFARQVQTTPQAYRRCFREDCAS